MIEGTSLKGLFEAVRPKAGAYIQHADYSYIVQDGDEIHIPPNIQSSGKIILSDESLLRIRIRSNPAIQAWKSKQENRTKININTAGIETLQTLPRIGPETARRIIAEREKHGPFRRKEDLLRVRGIGRKSYNWLEPLITAE